MAIELCKHGHELTPDNLVVYKSGKRRCRTCCRASMLKFRTANPEANRDWRNTNDNGRNSDYKSNYGITLDDYNKMLLSQHGVCAISGQSPSQEGYNRRRLAVDHNHVTGDVRQLLHIDINTALGLFQDNPEWLRRAADYVEFWNRFGGRPK